MGLLFWNLAGCDSGGDTTDGTGGGTTTGGTDGGTTGGTDGGTTGGTDGGATNNGGGGTSLSCASTANATLSTDQGDLTFTAATVAAAAKHTADSGCVTGLAIALDQDGGCTLSLTLETVDGVWSLTSGTLTVDATCGAGMAEAALGTYSLDVALSTGGLDGLPSVANTATTGCVSGATFDLTGLALFNGDNGKTLEVNLNGIALTGEVLSSPTTTGSCPAEIAACIDRTCGSDDHGKACGTCPDGEACLEGTCMVWNCPPEGPFGTHPGETLTDVELRDCDDNPVYLHELCGADAAYFNLLAGW